MSTAEPAADRSSAPDSLDEMLFGPATRTAQPPVSARPPGAPPAVADGTRGTLARGALREGLVRGAVKVPEIGVLFWVVKVLSTGVGEAASDFLAAHDLVVAAALGLLAFLAGLGLQLRARTYHPAVYWFAVTMVAVFGTMAADALHVVLGLPYVVTSAGYAAAVAGVFAVWYRREGTLDVHSVRAGRPELFYWAAVVATFALGTALGDLSAFTLGLGYAASAVLYAVLIALPAIGWWRFGLHPVVAFWSAYVVTRPLGASLADWFGKPADRSGLGVGDGTVTLVGLAVIAVLVGVLAVRHRAEEDAVAG